MNAMFVQMRQEIAELLYFYRPLAAGTVAVINISGKSERLVASIEGKFGAVFASIAWADLLNASYTIRPKFERDLVLQLFFDNDAVPMTKAEIIHRREQGRFQHLAATGQLLRLSLARAPKPADQAMLYERVSSAFLPFGLGPEHFEGRN